MKRGASEVISEALFAFLVRKCCTVRFFSKNAAVYSFEIQ
nr:MAG TPA: hypothetical protein [Caudoviricetes sp.]